MGHHLPHEGVGVVSLDQDLVEQRVRQLNKAKHGLRKLSWHNSPARCLTTTIKIEGEQVCRRKRERMTSIGSRNTVKSSKYRPEIDGLRAFAVVAVILNHFDKTLLPSGYLGVDIFFVISGYVITGSLLSHPSENVAGFFLDFYARRIKRILPALAAMVVIATPLACLFDPAPIKTLQTSIAALFGVSNISLYLDSTSYFSVSTDLNPLTHTWSLGVEEQFYLVFPLLVWLSGITRFRRHASLTFVGLLAPLFIFSLYAFIKLSSFNQPFAYFSMPTRFWEIGLGAFVLVALRQPILTRWCQRIPASLVMALLTAFLFTGFRVKTTIAIVFLTGLLLACLRASTPTYRLLTMEKVRWTGLVSYSLYLWHWPVLSLSRWTIGIQPWTVPLQLGAMVGLAYLSYRFVERPVRHASWLNGHRKSFGFGLGLAGGSALVPLLLLTWPGGRPLFTGDSKLEELQGNLSESKPLIAANCLWWMGEGPDPATAARTCIIKSKKGGINQRFYVMGDSHTGHLDDWLSRIPNRKGLWARKAYAGGQSVPLIENRWEGQASSRKRDAMNQQRLLDLTLTELKKGDVLLLITYSLQQFRTEEQRMEPGLTTGLSRWNAWWRDLDQLVRKVGERGASVVISSPTPDFQLLGGWDAFTSQNCTLQWYRSTLLPHCFLSKPRDQTLAEINPILTRLKALENQHANVYIFDPLPYLCEPDHHSCTNYVDGVRMYSDYSHLTKAGSRLISNGFEAFLRKHSLLNRNHENRQGSASEG